MSGPEQSPDPFLEQMVERARETPAVLVHRALVEGFGDLVKVTFGETSVTPADIQNGVTLSQVFRARTAIAISTADLMSFRDILNNMHADITAAAATGSNE